MIHCRSRLFFCLHFALQFFLEERRAVLTALRLATKPMLTLVHSTTLTTAICCCRRATVACSGGISMGCELNPLCLVNCLWAYWLFTMGCMATKACQGAPCWIPATGTHVLVLLTVQVSI